MSSALWSRGASREIASVALFVERTLCVDGLTRKGLRRSKQIKTISSDTCFNNRDYRTFIVGGCRKRHQACDSSLWCFGEQGILCGSAPISKADAWLARFDNHLMRKSAVYGLNGHRAHFVIALSLGTYGHGIQKSRTFTALFS
jgi:hypothetical protein